MKHPIVDIGEWTIDLREVESVSPLGGDPAWLRYKVYFKNGKHLEIYHERKYSNESPLIQMNRDEFITKWKTNTIL